MSYDGKNPPRLELSPEAIERIEELIRNPPPRERLKAAFAAQDETERDYVAAGKATHQLCVWLLCQGHLSFEDFMMTWAKANLDSIRYLASAHCVLRGFEE